MGRLIALTVMVAIALMLSGCFDPEPGEISVIAKKNGRQHGCAILIYNSKGVQIGAEVTDMQGLVYIKNVKPGTYMLKFSDKETGLYPAEKTVTVGSGESKVVRVELTEAPSGESGEE